MCMRTCANLMHRGDQQHSLSRAIICFYECVSRETLSREVVTIVVLLFLLHRGDKDEKWTALGRDLVGGREIFQFHFVSCNRLFSRAIETFTRDHYFISAQHERLGNFVWRNASAIYRYTRILGFNFRELMLNEMQRNFFTFIFFIESIVLFYLLYSTMFQKFQIKITNFFDYFVHLSTYSYGLSSVLKFKKIK